MAKKLFNMKVKFRNKGNGMELPITLEKLMNVDGMRRAALSAMAMKLEDMMNMVRNRTFRRVSMFQRALNYDEPSLMEAYKDSLNKSVVVRSARGVSMKLMDSSVLDRLLPNNARRNKGYGGWWRLFEFGSFGKYNNVYANSLYTFVPIGGGRHGEGVMMKKTDHRVPDKLKRGHKGIRPFRIVRGMHIDMEHDFNSASFGNTILDNMFQAIAKGAR
jgi:hypothetical protein